MANDYISECWPVMKKLLKNLEVRHQIVTRIMAKGSGKQFMSVWESISVLATVVRSIEQILTTRRIKCTLGHILIRRTGNWKKAF